MAPFTSALPVGSIPYILVYFLLGLAFGAVLESSGFGDSRKLAAQFYLRDLTVLKVMFTGIIVAAVLIHLASGLELLDLSRVWINPTYLVPGIAGGLIMGVGFIVGGFCPGTSLVAAATLKLDGVLFVLGGLFGVFAFGETVRGFDGWWHSTYLGRLTISNWLGIPTGLAVLLVTIMALGMFYLAEMAEKRFGGTVSASPPKRRALRAAAAGLVALCLVLIAVGQPGLQDRWRWLSGQTPGRQLAGREVFVDPAEVVDLRRDLSLAVRVLEVRTESDYNLFHIAGSERIDRGAAADPALVRSLLDAADNTIVFLAGNGESAAVEVWKGLKSQGAVNLYIIEGGINHWLDVYPVASCVAQRVDTPGGGDPRDDEAPRYRFLAAVGERSPSAHPDLSRSEPALVCGTKPEAGPAAAIASFTGVDAGTPKRDYVKKVQIQKKTVVKGGCG